MNHVKLNSPVMAL